MYCLRLFGKLKRYINLFLQAHLYIKLIKIEIFRGSRAKKYFGYFKTDNDEKAYFQPFGAGSDNAPMATIIIVKGAFFYSNFEKSPLKP